MEGDATNLAQSALARYGLRGARADSLGTRRGDKSLFRVDAPRPRRLLLGGLLSRSCAPRWDRFLLRMHERGTVGEAGLRSEMLWLEELVREARLNVPAPVPAADDSLVARVCAEGGLDLRLCVLTRWVPGEKRTPDLAPEDTSAAGALVARMHRHSERYAAPEGFARPPAYDWERVFGGGSPLWTEGAAVYSPEELAVFRVAADRICGVLRELGTRGDAFGIIHSDPTPNNFVFLGRDARIIDFASCGWGHYLHDVAVALSALGAYGERRAGLRAAFLEGYRLERPLAEGQLVHLGAFRAMRLARRVATVIGRGGPAARGWGPKRFSSLMEMIGRYAAGDGGVESMDLGP